MNPTRRGFVLGVVAGVGALALAPVDGLPPAPLPWAGCAVGEWFDMRHEVTAADGSKLYIRGRFRVAEKIGPRSVRVDLSARDFSARPEFVFARVGA